MKTILFVANLSLVIWLTSGSNEKQRKIYEEEVFENILDRGKRVASPGVGIHFFRLHALRRFPEVCCVL